MHMIAMFRLPASCATVFTALVLMRGDGSARHFQPPAVRDDIEEVVKLLQQKVVNQAQVAKKVKAIKGKHSLEDLMAIYKPTAKKGIGWNPAKKGKGDGIESRIHALGKKELTKDQLAQEKDHIVRAAHYNLAMVEIANGFGPPKKPGKGINNWTRHNEEMKEGTKEVLAAVKANDPKALKKAMLKINAGCNGCHYDFRD
jgi:Cytochrome C'